MPFDRLRQKVCAYPAMTLGRDEVLVYLCRNEGKPFQCAITLEAILRWKKIALRVLIRDALQDDGTLGQDRPSPVFRVGTYDFGLIRS